jgi:carbamoyltransferase
MTYILGISAFYHDSSACLIRNGEIISAAQEEWFSRRKHDPAFPIESVRYCLQVGGITAADLDCVAFYEKPNLKFDRLLRTFLSYVPLGAGAFAEVMPVWLREKLWIKESISQTLGYAGEILFPEHHESHAASAFYPSPFQNAAFLTVDGVGEWTTTSFGVGQNNRIAIKSTIDFPHSLGLLYSAFTYYTGFKVNSGEYKLMGLAPYGKAEYKDLILKELIDVKADGSFRLNMAYFDYCVGNVMTSDAFHQLFGGPPRNPESLLTQRDMDLARSVQEVTEEIMLRMVRHIHVVTGQKHLCLAGGVALNCVSNGRIAREGPFEKLWIQPASGDAGGALGAALFAWHMHRRGERIPVGEADSQRSSLLGPAFNTSEVRSFLTDQATPFEELDDEAMYDRVADLMATKNVIGWFQGRMEFGPRALGSRSIIADPRSPEMQEVINLKIKFRESFRPFAPSVLEEYAGEYFQLTQESPYMLLVAPVREEKRKSVPDEEKLWGLEKLHAERSVIPAVTHVDYTARVQTVTETSNPKYYKLIKRFNEKYGCPMVVNTSFNVRGEPIVCTPSDAYRCFMRTNMDFLVLDRFLLRKSDQPPLREDANWQSEYELD